MPLTDTTIRTTKPSPAPVKIYDDGGLFLLISPAGGKWWRLKYRFGGVEKLLSLGTYPDVSLKVARERRDVARRLLADGVDPSEHRRKAKAMAVETATHSFEAVAVEWLAKFGPTWCDGHRERAQGRLRNDVFPWLGKRAISEITAADVLVCLQRVEARGALHTAHRVRQTCGQVFRYAVSTGRAQRDPTGDLKGALPPAVEEHHASITDPKLIGGLLRAIDGYQGSFVTKCALQLAPLLFVRPGELRQAEWQEFDIDTAEWRIPAERMKMREQHRVPLSTQAVAILRELRPLTGDGRYVFSGVRTAARPMSNNTVNAALRRLGFTKDEMTGHGFRSMASTLLNERGWSADAIEAQLAHGERNKIRAAYNFAKYLPERREMMQWWADCLGALRSGAPVIPLRAVSAASA